MHSFGFSSGRPARFGLRGIGVRAGQPAQVLGVAEQVQSPPQRAARNCLAGVAGESAVLRCSVDRYYQVYVCLVMADELGSQLRVQRVG